MTMNKLTIFSFYYLFLCYNKHYLKMKYGYVLLEFGSLQHNDGTYFHKYLIVSVEEIPISVEEVLQLVGYHL